MASASKKFPPRRYSAACVTTNSTSVIGKRITHHLCSFKGTLVVEERRQREDSRNFVGGLVTINRTGDFVDGRPDLNKFEEILGGNTSTSKAPRTIDEESKANKVTEITSAEISCTGKLRCTQSFPIFPCIEDKIIPCCVCKEENVDGYEVVVETVGDHWGWTVRQVQDHWPVEARLGGSQGLLMWRINDCVVFGFRSPGSQTYYVSAIHRGTGGLMLVSGLPHPYTVSERDMRYDLRFFREEYDPRLGPGGREGIVLKPEFNHDMHVSVVGGLLTIVYTEGFDYKLWSIR